MSEPDPVDVEAEEAAPEPGIDPSTAALGVGGLAAGAGALALAARAPGRVGSIIRGIDALRKQMMLSGYALPKSVLGNLGAVAETAVERGSMEPIRQLLSRQTLREAGQAWKAGGLSGGIQGVDVVQAKNPLTRLAAVLSPGRVMGSLDEATQGALRRSGLSATDARRAVLQAPLEGKLGEALEGPVSQYFHPFRRTPFNQFIEGNLKMTRAAKGQMSRGELTALGLQSGIGAAHGAATAESDVPLSIPFGIAAAARGGVPYGIAALLGRLGAGGGLPGSGIVSAMLPVSEYGVESGLTDPLRPFYEPAAIRAIDRLTGSR
jgi:hypothetical protein